MMVYKVCKVCDGDINLLNEKYNLGQCNNCKLIFCLKVFTQEEFIEVYDRLYNAKDAIYSRHSVHEYNMLLANNTIEIGFYRSRLIKKHILNSKCESVLEIGSGVGLIGSYIRNKNQKIKYTGIEIDKESFDKSRSLNLNTINADFSEMDNIKETFDVIMLWEVIEHLQDLKRFLELAYKRLNKNGKIILSTPNYEKIYNYPKRDKDQIFQDFPPVHINFFTKENIINIFEINQFKNCKSFVKKFPYKNFKSQEFYINFLKAFINKYKGSTIYFEASKQ